MNNKTAKILRKIASKTGQHKRAVYRVYLSMSAGQRAKFKRAEV